MANNFSDLTGQVFGKIYIVGLISSYSDKLHHSNWLCRCVCGIEFTKTSSNIKRGKNVGCDSCYRAHRKYRPFEALYNILVKVAKDKNIFVLDYEEYLKFTLTKICHYCNEYIDWKPYKSNEGYKLDRKDNNLGYTKENCVVCCARCNKAKSDHFTYEQWLEIGKLIRSWSK